MKNITPLSLLGAAALTFTPAPAKAGSEGAAALGGFIGGLIVGKMIDGPSHHHSTSVSVSVGHHSGSRHHHHYHDRGHRHGYWDTVRVKVWVPGYWTTRYERGCHVRYHVPGRHEWRTERVWVEHPSREYSSPSYSYRR